MANTNKRLAVIFGDVTLGLKGPDFHYLFFVPNGWARIIADSR